MSSFIRTSVIKLDEAQARLPEILKSLNAGQELYIVNEKEQVIGKLTGVQPPRTEPRIPGTAKGKIIIIKDDDSHLEDFKEYM